MSTPRAQIADELLRRLAALLRSSQLYSKGHPIIGRNLDSFSAAIQLLHSLEPSVVIGLVGEQIIVDDVPMKPDTLGTLAKRLRQIGVERITIDRGVTLDELRAFVEAVSSADAARESGGLEAAFPSSAHLRVGRVSIDQRVEGTRTDMATLKGMYADAVSAATSV